MLRVILQYYRYRKSIMKRSFPSNMAQPNEYQVALKKVNLVERNTAPDGYQLLNSRNVGKHQSDDIVALAQQIQTADLAIRNTATGKLCLILEQIKFLQAQAQRILEETENSTSIHSAACNFRKVAGKIYHLYKRESGQTYLSILSPTDWGPKLTHEFVGSFRLEQDQTWTPIDRMADVSKQNAWAQNLLNSTTPAIRHKSFLAIDQCD